MPPTTRIDQPNGSRSISLDVFGDLLKAAFEFFGVQLIRVAKLLLDPGALLETARLHEARAFLIRQDPFEASSERLRERGLKLFPLGNGISMLTERF